MMRRTEGEMNDAMEMKLENTSQLPLKDQLGETSQAPTTSQVTEHGPGSHSIVVGVVQTEGARLAKLL